MADIKVRRASLRRAGQRAVALIVKRTQQGKDKNNVAFEPYSTTPFAMPAGGGARGTLQEMVDEERASFFETKQGALWAVVNGGYAAYKAARYGQDDGTVNLSATGSMMRGLTVTAVSSRGENGRVTIGFTRIEEANKAYYHTVSGAGPSRTIRDFMGLTDEGLDEVQNIVADGLTIDLE